MNKIFRVFDVDSCKTETISCFATREQANAKAAEIVQREMKKSHNLYTKLGQYLADIDISHAKDVLKSYDDIRRFVETLTHNLHRVYIDEIPDVTTCTEEEKKAWGLNENAVNNH